MDAGENALFEQKRYENQKIKEALGAMLPDTRALLAFYKK
jgi:hypothetical protein